MALGDIIRVYYQLEIDIEVDETMKEKIRNKAIADSVWGSIMSASIGDQGITNPDLQNQIRNQAIVNLQKSTQKGFSLDNEMINSLEKRQLIKNEYLQVGQLESKERIKEIESLSGFISWLTEFEIDEIKNS